MITTVTVWVLLLYASGFHHGGPAVVDNIATSLDCEKTGLEAIKSSNYDSYKCIEVKKVMK